MSEPQLKCYNKWIRKIYSFTINNKFSFVDRFQFQSSSLDSLVKNLKLVSTIFHQIFIFHQITALQKLWKMFFISSKNLFSFLGYLNFCIFVFPSFFPVSHCFRSWSKKNLKIYDDINCLNKNLITHFVWYLAKEIRCDIQTLSTDRELNKEHFYW